MGGGCGKRDGGVAANGVRSEWRVASGMGAGGGSERVNLIGRNGGHRGEKLTHEMKSANSEAKRMRKEDEGEGGIGEASDSKWCKQSEAVN